MIGHWDRTVSHKPSYFGIAWGCVLAQAPEHATRIAELAVARYPDDRGFKNELESLRTVVAGSPR